MSYNPLIDLFIGLLLIAIPIVVLAALGYLLLFRHTCTDNASVRLGSLENWPEWVSETLEQAYRWRTRFDRERASSDAARTLSPGNGDLDELIRVLERLNDFPASPGDQTHPT